MTPFGLDYFLFVFIAASGVLQMVASYTGLQGLLLLRNRRWAFALGFAVIVLSFLWFFSSEPRNIPDTAGGLDGNEQAGFFALAAGSALLFTLLLSSLRNLNLGNGASQYKSGLDALRETNYLRALRSTIKAVIKRW